MSKKQNAGNPGWLRWIVLAFIIYAVYMHFTGKVNPEQQTEQLASMHNPTSPSGVKATQIPDISDPTIRIAGEVKGRGEKARCGQQATLRLSGAFPNGKAYSEGFEAMNPMTVQVGKHDAMRPWLAGIPGMQLGGVREVQIPAAYLFQTPEALEKQNLQAVDIMQFNLYLDDLTPSIAPGNLDLRAFDMLQGRGDMALCGDTVQFKLSIWAADGTEIFTSSTAEDSSGFTINLGEGELFYGLDRGIVGMRSEGIRTIIIPPAYMVSGVNITPHSLLESLPKDQYIIVDVALMGVNKAQR